MNLDYNEEYKSFEKEVQDFCKQYKDISFSDGAKIPFSAKGGNNKNTIKRSDWQKILIEKGYFARSVPKKYGVSLPFEDLLFFPLINVALPISSALM